MPADLWIRTPRLELRPPDPSDLPDYVRLHTDPRTYAHAPHTMPTPERCRERLAGDIAQWASEGLSYAAVVDRATGEVIGWGGLREEEQGDRYLNLYYRLAPDRLGRGLGRELARAVVAWGVEHRPQLPLTAVVHQHNAASLATVRGAGLRPVGTLRHHLDPPDAPAMLHFAAPTVRLLDPDTAPVDELLDLWVRVNDSGGAVGFVPGASRADVRAALDVHLADAATGRGLAAALVEPDGRLLGLAFWRHDPALPFSHVARLGRLMVDPAARGRNLGRLLLAGMVGLARRELPGVELLELEYRGGLGLGDFYAAAGWTEVGRSPSALWLGGRDYRDAVTMARRVDGGPLAADGRT
ncbi:MAG TPA: GNAT family N-acetyltransferase [Intrasporangium sp.]|uniref:GNAT family N-acetyltransferase n=1 Tax=Intrasporangium sp. TaxID=1925024 RepID=UPI002D76A5CF|nr:GNAT family N-acetyltransferase [Intrasporangium sp.]HET7397312.1 GNAT family N-acetyltransferase [Intrasporangium sp.]